MGIKVKSIGFNDEDQHQKRLLEHCNSIGNFSAYVKALVFHDMESAPEEKQKPQQLEMDVNSFI